MCKAEGIIPALEPSHAIYQTMELAKSMGKDKVIVLNLCGRGDKDMHTVARAMGVTLDNYAETKDSAGVREKARAAAAAAAAKH